MRTGYNAYIDSQKDEYSIQFETGNYEYFKMVEKVCRDAQKQEHYVIYKGVKEWERYYSEERIFRVL